MSEWQYRAAFVIQFLSETDIDAGCVKGRVEHVASCKAAFFQSLDELLAFLANVLAEVNTRQD